MSHHPHSTYNQRQEFGPRERGIGASQAEGVQSTQRPGPTRDTGLAGVASGRGRRENLRFSALAARVLAPATAPSARSSRRLGKESAFRNPITAPAEPLCGCLGKRLCDTECHRGRPGPHRGCGQSSPSLASSPCLNGRHRDTHDTHERSGPPVRSCRGRPENTAGREKGRARERERERWGAGERKRGRGREREREREEEREKEGGHWGQWTPSQLRHSVSTPPRRHSPRASRSS